MESERSREVGLHKVPLVFNTTNQSRDISTDPNKRFGLYIALKRKKDS